MFEQGAVAVAGKTLQSWPVDDLDVGIRFLKNENGDYAVKKVHHIGTYVLPMPNGETVKKALYRQLRRARILISNRYMATRLLTASDGRVAGAISVNTRTAEILVIKAKAVILCMGAAGRLELPTSGYMFGTYENAANSGDGYAMAYHAGAALANLECFQINPLIKDYNGPACAYVAGRRPCRPPRSWPRVPAPGRGVPLRCR
jgi:succinate dehydrogenase/fumarate reductase flavoprotein subunit